jgi:hypothetical protein
VADAAVMARSSPNGPSFVYTADGDGGSDNRVMKIRVDPSGATVVWATPAIFDNPHSIALHERSDILVVADREHAAIVLLDATNGKRLGIWDCGLDFGEEGVPFGVRTLTNNATGDDLVIVASMDNPQDHMHQRITIVDASELSKAQGAQSKCSVIQTIQVDPAKYAGPHLLGVDARNGDIYAALVADAPLSTVLRFTRQ